MVREKKRTRDHNNKNCCWKGCDLPRYSKQGYCKSHAARYMRSYKFGITEEQLVELLKTKRCELCDNELTIQHIDHCHKTGKIRGVLCNGCNTGLGKFKDDVELMRKAIRYLELD
tara:strand:+ start:296 stop:640 length:345 start_codon:yes stop_codon:yes gene_type:complete